MDNAKYIIVRSPAGYEQVFIFSPSLNHRKFAELVQSLGVPVSAGFISLEENCKVRALGESISLSLRSRPQDSEILTKQLDPLWDFR